MTRQERFAFTLLLVLMVVASVIGLWPGKAHAAAVAGYPPQAEHYRRDLVRTARYVFGMGAPVALLAGQVHQESAWRADARSAYASGLAQFTPDTVKTMAQLYPAELRASAPLDPRWALLALCRYDARLIGMFTGATQADRWAFALAAYNGGPGWIIRDRAKAKAQGLDHLVWFGQVEAVNAGRAPQFYRENRDYPRRILLRHQPLYLSWGPGVSIEGVQ